MLLMLSAAFTYTMIAPGGAWGRLGYAVLVGAAVIATLTRAAAGRKLFYAARAAIAVTLAAALAAAAVPAQFAAIADFVSAGLLLLVPTAIALEFRRDLTVTPQSVLAALCIYVVLGMFYASLASGIAGVSGLPYFAGQSRANSADFTYFSFITLSTVGYGDLAPVLRLGRALAVLEGLSGQLYLVTVVALVVSNVRLSRGARE